MRIHITGFSAKFAGKRGSTKGRVYSLSDTLLQAFDLLGHQVTRGPVNETDIDADIIIYHHEHLGLLGSRYGTLALTHQAQMRRIGVPVLALIEDANLPPYIKQLNSFQKPARIIGRTEFSGFTGPTLAWVRMHAEETAAYITELRQGRWPATVACAFPWHDKAVLHESFGAPINYWLDPSQILEDMTRPEAQVRSREWILAGMKPYDKWLEAVRPTWPVARYGIVKQGNPELLTERALVQRMQQSWGVLSPSEGHTSKGSGWWRARFVFAAQAGCVLTADEGEVAHMGIPYKLSLWGTEELSDDNLRKLAGLQAEWFWRNTWPADKFVAHVDGMLQDIVTGSVTTNLSAITGAATVYTEL